jgi:hypothetical protein
MVIWAELYVSATYIALPLSMSWNQVPRLMRVVAALERIGSRGCCTGRRGWSCGRVEEESFCGGGVVKRCGCCRSF